MRGRVGETVGATVTALTALVLAHNLIFLAGYGAEFGDVLGHTGHDHGWTIAVVGSVLLGVALLIGTAWRLHRLRRIARSLGATRTPSEPGQRAFLRRWLGVALALALAVTALFVLEENLELGRISRQLPGIGVLASAAYPNAVLIIGAVALVVSFVAVLLGWRIELVIARIRAVQGRPQEGATSPFAPRAWVAPRRTSVLGSRLASRAPPPGLVSQA